MAFIDRRTREQALHQVQPVSTMVAPLSSENRTIDARGVRKRAAEIGRKLVPTLRLPDREEDVSIKREAYQLALANRHKPWARRYLRSVWRL